MPLRRRRLLTEQPEGDVLGIGAGLDQHRLVGRRTGRIYRLGDPVTVRLAEANPVTGGLILKIVEDEQDGTGPGRGAGPRQKQGRGGKPPAGKSGRGKPDGRRRARR